MANVPVPYRDLNCKAFPSCCGAVTINGLTDYGYTPPFKERLEKLLAAMKEGPNPDFTHAMGGPGLILAITTSTQIAEAKELAAQGFLALPYYNPIHLNMHTLWAKVMEPELTKKFSKKDPGFTPTRHRKAATKAVVNDNLGEGNDL